MSKLKNYLFIATNWEKSLCVCHCKFFKAILTFVSKLGAYPQLWGSKLFHLGILWPMSYLYLPTFQYWIKLKNFVGHRLQHAEWSGLKVKIFYSLLVAAQRARAFVLSKILKAFLIFACKVGDYLQVWCSTWVCCGPPAISTCQLSNFPIFDWVKNFVGQTQAWLKLQPTEWSGDKDKKKHFFIDGCWDQKLGCLSLANSFRLILNLSVSWEPTHRNEALLGMLWPFTNYPLAIA